MDIGTAQVTCPRCHATITVEFTCTTHRPTLHAVGTPPRLGMTLHLLPIDHDCGPRNGGLPVPIAA